MISLFLVLSSALSLQEEKSADKVAAEALEAFHKAFKGTEAEKLVAVEDLAKVQHPRTASKLAALLPAAEPTSVRVVAAKALGGFGEHKRVAAAGLVNALASTTKEAAVFGAICESLGKLGESVVLPALARH